MDDGFKPANEPDTSLQAVPEFPKPPETNTTDKNDTPFQTPEEVAAAQTLDPAKEGEAQAAAGPATDTAGTPSDKKGWLQKLNLSWPPGKKEYIIAAVLVILIGSGSWWLISSRHQPTPVPKTTANAPKNTAAAASTTVPSTLTGLPVDPSVNQRPVTGVMIENSTWARPQSGLGQAGVVFEAIAEGGITRFLALFQDTQPTNVGPIRSVRPYYEQWALGFDAGLAHVGGSPEALSDIKKWKVRDLDEFYNAGYYHRISSRQAPHNMYTGIPTLNQLETKKGFTSSSFTGFPRKRESPAKTPTASVIKFTLSGPDYNVVYRYDAATNSYKRAEAGAAHIDANNGGQIAPKVVIAMIMHYGLEKDGYHSDYNAIGSGPVDIFQDGTVTAGQWSKTSASSQISFTSANGKAIKLNPGTTWLTAIAQSSYVSYTATP
jgi:hypothetical protein